MILFQLTAKISLVYRYQHEIIINIERIIYIYEANAKTEIRKRALLLRNISMFCEVLFIVGFFVYMGFTCLLYINPIYGYFWLNEYRPSIPLYIPFIDEKTTIGFVMLLMIQAVEIFLATLASLSADLPYIIWAINVHVYSTVFKENVNELNDILRTENQVDFVLATAKLRNIFKMYNDVWL